MKVIPKLLSRQRWTADARRRPFLLTDGEPIDLPDELAQRLIDAGRAEAAGTSKAKSKAKSARPFGEEVPGPDAADN